MYSSLKKLKFLLDKVCKPAMLLLFRLGVRPLHLTLLSFLFGFLGALSLYTDWLRAILFLLLWFLLDVFDGMLARVSETESKFGVWVDFLVDRVVLLLILVRYYQFNPESMWTVVGGLSIVLILTLGELFRK